MLKNSVSKVFTKKWSCVSFNGNNDNEIILEQANQQIRVISEKSRDTENWSNDAENSVLPSQELNCILKHI